MAEMYTKRLDQDVFLFSNKQYDKYKLNLKILKNSNVFKETKSNENIINFNLNGISLIGCDKENTKNDDNTNVISPLKSYEVFEDVTNLGKYLYELAKKFSTKNDNCKANKDSDFKVPIAKIMTYEEYVNKQKDGNTIDNIFEKHLNIVFNRKLYNVKLNHIDTTIIDNIILSQTHNKDIKLLLGEFQKKYMNLQKKYKESLSFDGLDNGEEENNLHKENFGSSDYKRLRINFTLYMYIYVINEIFKIILNNNIKNEKLDLSCNKNLISIFPNTKVRNELYEYLMFLYNINDLDNSEFKFIISYLFFHLNLIENDTSILGYRTLLLSEDKECILVECYNSIAGIAFEHLKKFINYAISDGVVKTCKKCGNQFWYPFKSDEIKSKSDNKTLCDSCSINSLYENNKKDYDEGKEIFSYIQNATEEQINKLKSKKDQKLVIKLQDKEITYTTISNRKQDKYKKILIKKGLDQNKISKKNLRRVKEELESS